MEGCVSQLRTLRLRSNDVSDTLPNIFSECIQPIHQCPFKSMNKLATCLITYVPSALLHTMLYKLMNACPHYHLDNNDCLIISPLSALVAAAGQCE